ncbi:MAG: DUF1328 domain-containing protein [Gemmatimonadaceae bacterium]|nr:DUF1328 domain-containing protein [Gloeobacterales cyanobacterium ES-bin-141]
MLNLLWTVVVLMIVAALLGFGGVVAALGDVAWFLVIAAVVFAVLALFTGRRVV